MFLFSRRGLDTASFGNGDALVRHSFWGVHGVGEHVYEHYLGV